MCVGGGGGSKVWVNREQAVWFKRSGEKENEAACV